MKTENLVLYAVIDGKRQPVASCGGDDDAATFVLNAAASEAIAKARASGSELPALKVVRESRESDESGKLVSAQFVECDPRNLRARGEPVGDLDSLFRKEK